MTSDSEGFVSPPCFMHEIAADGVADPRQRADVMRWRKAERERLIGERLAIESHVRQANAERISGHLEAAIGAVEGLTVSAYWPFRGEPDLRGLMRLVVERGGCAALPVVVRKGAPLLFRAWTPGEKLERGVWNIPIPPETAPIVVPEVVIAPVVGFDPARYRLGYGGGFFDRTLAALPQRPRVFGVGYEQQAVPTIYPQPHDIAMDAIVTEQGLT